jgi:hypothetical protein
MVFTEQQKKHFCRMIEERVINSKLTYIEAILECCEQMNLEPETAGKFLNPPLKEKLAVEFEDINLLPKTKSKLPI